MKVFIMSSTAIIILLVVHVNILEKDMEAMKAKIEQMECK